MIVIVAVVVAVVVADVGKASGSCTIYTPDKNLEHAPQQNVFCICIVPFQLPTHVRWVLL